MQVKIKMVPVRNITNFELLAQTLSKRLDPTNKPRKKSAPPKITKRAITTTICMNNILFFGNLNARTEKKAKKKPKIDGIREVND